MDAFKDNLVRKYLDGELTIKPKIGVWENVDKNGKIYYKFSLGNIKYKMFKNDFKTKPTHPDYIIYESETQKPVNNE